MPGGVFCIENWSADLRSPDTVRPLLDYLVARDVARVVHQRVDTPQELRHYLSRFAALQSYGVCYLAMHGARGRVYVGNEPLTLQTLSEWGRLGESTDEDEDWRLDLRRKVVCLGSCSTLNTTRDRMREFRDVTGAIAVCGYTKRIDWLDSGGFEIMLLSALAAATAGKSHRVGAAIKRLRRENGDLIETLGFRCEPSWNGGT